MDVDLGHLKKPCACGKEHELNVREIYIESGAVTHLIDILENYQNPVLLCDSNTRAAAEPFLEEEFKDYPVIELNPEGLIADNESVDKVMTQLDFCDRGCSAVCVDILVAIGAGTIHDLTRYAANEYGIPFVSIPTAASMDGYLSHMAALTWDGVKKTFPAVAPTWVLADTDIFAKAPYRLTAAGISDLMGKHIALLDWKVAHLVTDEYYCEEIAELLERSMREVEKVLDDIYRGDAESIEQLMFALLLSGLTMQMVGSSRPASGAEHHVSHLLEMEVINPRLDALHGEKVSAGLFLVTHFYRKLAKKIRAGKVQVQNETLKGFEFGLLEQTFGAKDEELLESVIDENTPNPLEDIDLEQLEEDLPQIAKMIEEIPKYKDLKKQLQSVGCVTSLEAIGLAEEKGEELLRLSPYVRNRMTLLRLSKLFEIEK